MPRNRTRKGFTLIELLIVVVIIGILAAIAIPKFAETKEKAYMSSMKSDLKNIATSAEAYFSDENTYVGFTPNPASNGGDVITFTPDGAAGWSASASHPGAPGWTCINAAGSTVAAGLPDGEVTCSE
jgi:prepilin-type N-terminal cleavage/methylation domain-containing protein